jgi:hypothetical protein
MKQLVVIMGVVCASAVAVRGQTTYLRLKGLVPPSSESQ